MRNDECARCRYADGCRERLVIDAALRLYHVGLAPSGSYREFREAIQANGLYEEWRGTQRSVRGSNGSESDDLSGELPCFGDINRTFCSSKGELPGLGLCSRCRARPQ